MGIESRGFIFAAPLALKLGCSLAIVRKPGKLSYETVSTEYSLEYGVDTLELHTDSIKKSDRVLIVDDLMAIRLINLENLKSTIMRSRSGRNHV